MQSNFLPRMLAAGLAFLLAACGAPAADGSPTLAQNDPTQAAATQTKPPQPTPLPTNTPEPQKVFLVAPPGSDAALAQSAAVLLGNLAAAEGMTFEQLPALASAPPGTRVAVFLDPGAEIKNLAGNTPEVQFVAIGTLDLQPLEANLSQILAQPEATAFLAGYVAALTAPDWRVGGLLLNTPATLEQAFSNGVRYHCGRCAPQYAPIVLFPVTKPLPASSDSTAVSNAFKELDANLLEVVYVAPGLESPELLTQLAEQDVALIGTNLSDETLRPQWIASVRSDSLLALEDLWPDLLAGKGAKSNNAPLVIEDVNPERLSEGRLRLVMEAIYGLGSGAIAPIVP